MGGRRGVNSGQVEARFSNICVRGDISDVDFDNIPEVGCSYWGTLGDNRAATLQWILSIPIAGGYTHEYTLLPRMIQNL